MLILKRGLLLFGVALIFAVTLSRVLGEFQHARDRGKLVSSVIRNHVESLGALSIIVPSFHQPTEEFAPLQQWLVGAWARNLDPSEIRAAFAELRKLYRSASMEISMTRWEVALERWASTRSVSDWLGEGRERHAEAVGYLKIGRPDDASVLYVWAASALTRFIYQDPEHPLVPEALFLLGDIMVRLKKALPRGVQSDRILRLCVDYYPGTVWARRAVTSLHEDERERQAEGAI